MQDLSLSVIFWALEIKFVGTSLVVQWLRLRAPNAGGLGSIPGQGIRSRMLQLRPRAAKINLKIKFVVEQAWDQLRFKLCSCNSTSQVTLWGKKKSLKLPEPQLSYL